MCMLHQRLSSCYCVQWSPSNPDTLGWDPVLVAELWRCPHLRVSRAYAKIDDVMRPVTSQVGHMEERLAHLWCYS